MAQQFITPRDLAQSLGISEARLAALRSSGRGPSFIKISTGGQGAVRYPVEAIRLWLESRLTQTDGQVLPDDVLTVVPEVRTAGINEAGHVR